MSTSEVIGIYNKRAKRYNMSTLLLYNLLGMRINRHRNLAVNALGLKKGGTVVEIGCGTGANFPYLQKVIGPNGKIVGVDLTPSMLAEAKHRVEAKGWRNVELVESGAAAYVFPENVDAIISTFALTMAPEYDDVIHRGSSSLRPGGKWVVMDFKMPTNWLKRFIPLLIHLVKPYGGTLEMTARHPWESFEKYLSNVSVRQFWFGMAYIAEGER